MFTQLFQPPYTLPTITIDHHSDHRVTRDNMSLLALFCELRYEIYSYLTPLRPKYHPYGYSLITSISHRPPSELRKTCLFLYNDIKTYFYSTATVTFCPHRWSDTYECPDRAKCAIRCTRKARLWFHWRYKSAAKCLEADIERMEDILFFLLDEAKLLMNLTLAVCDLFDDSTEWDIREKTLAPLKMLKGRVTFVLEKFTGRNNREDEMREKMEDYVRELNEVEA